MHGDALKDPGNDEEDRGGERGGEQERAGGSERRRNKNMCEGSGKIMIVMMIIEIMTMAMTATMMKFLFVALQEKLLDSYEGDSTLSMTTDLVPGFTAHQQNSFTCFLICL